MADFHTRRDKLRKALAKSGTPTLLVTNPVNVSYLSGFTGEDSYLLVRPDGDVLLSDSRFTTQLEEECPGLDCVIRGPGVKMVELTARTLKKARVKRLGVEADSMTLGLRDRLCEADPKLEIVGTTGLIESLRQTKDADEIARLRRAIQCAEKAFGVLRASLRPEKTEKQLAADLDHEMRQFGASGCSFPTIVAAGARAALPHASASDTPIGESASVLVDWGATVGMYRSDLTRVLVTGKISTKLERLYRVVLSAQERAVAAIRPGVVSCQVDGAARQVIEEAGFGRFFGHGLGHGIGLEVHEAPRLAADTQIELRPGMVVTVEPGIYLPGWGGIRIEDDVLVTHAGHEVLTSVPKQWDEVMVG